VCVRERKREQEKESEVEREKGREDERERGRERKRRRVDYLKDTLKIHNMNIELTFEIFNSRRGRRRKMSQTTKNEGVGELVIHATHRMHAPEAQVLRKRARKGEREGQVASRLQLSTATRAAKRQFG